AAEGGQLAELGAHIVGAIAGEHRAVVGRAVVLVLDEDDGEEGVLAQEAAVFVRVLEGPLHRLQVLLEAAAVDAELRHAGELVGELADVVGHAGPGGRVELVDDVGLAVGDRRAGVADLPGRAGHGVRRAGEETAAIAVAGARLTAAPLGAGADIGRDHTDVDVRQATFDALEHA